MDFIKRLGSAVGGLCLTGLGFVNIGWTIFVGTVGLALALTDATTFGLVPNKMLNTAGAQFINSTFNVLSNFINAYNLFNYTCTGNWGGMIIPPKPITASEFAKDFHKTPLNVSKI